MKSRAPLLLGRGVVTRSAAEVPDQWSGTEGFVIDGQLLDDSVRLEKTVDELQRRYVNRNPTVFVLDVDPEELNAFETTDAPPYELGSEFTFLREMVERLPEGERLNVRTIHSIGWEILPMGKPGLRLIDEAEQRRRLEPVTSSG